MPPRSDERRDDSVSHRDDDDLPREPDDSDPESAPTSEEEEAEYNVDAIKYAVKKDSRRTRVNGYVGWHYGTMWGPYLKIGSETEEPRESFQDDDGNAPIIDEFWRGVGRTYRPGENEPPSRGTELVEATPRLLKRWFRRSTIPRDYPTYVRRRAKELAGKPVQKRDSDYYLRKKRIKATARAKAAGGSHPDAASPTANGFGQANAEAGPSGTQADARAGSPALSEVSEHYSIFSDSETEDDEAEEEGPLRSTQRSEKRRRVVHSPGRSPEVTKRMKKDEKAGKESEERKSEKRKDEKREERRKDEKKKGEKRKDEKRKDDKKKDKGKDDKKRKLEEDKGKGKKKDDKEEKKKREEERKSKLKERSDLLSTMGRIKKHDANDPAPPPKPPAPDNVASLAPIPPPAAPPSVQVPPATSPAVPSPSTNSPSIFGAPESSIFGAPDNDVFGAPDVVPEPVAQPAPPSQASPVHRNQEPLFDFGESPRRPSRQLDIPPTPEQDQPVTVEVEVQGPITKEVTPPAQAEEEMASNGPTGTEAIALTDEPMVIDAGSPAPAEQATLTVDPDEMPSSTLTNQTGAPSVMVTEPTPRKDSLSEEGEVSDDLFGSPPPESPVVAPAESGTAAAAPPAESGTTVTAAPAEFGTTATAALAEPEVTAPSAAAPAVPPAGCVPKPAVLAKVPPKERKTYEQQKRIQMIDIDVAPEHSRRHGLPTRPNVPKPVSPRLTIHPSLPSVAPATPALSPVQKAQELIARQQGPLKQQDQLWKQQQQQRPPRGPQQQQQRPPPPHARGPPGRGPGGKSPTYGGHSPVVGYGGQPVGAFGGASPLNGGRSPVYGAAPGINSLPPKPATSFSAIPPQRPIGILHEDRDPRKRARNPPPIGTATNGANGAASSAESLLGSSSLKVTIVGRQNVDFELFLKDGAARDGQFNLKKFTCSHTPIFEEVEAACLKLAFTQGAEVGEWNKVSVEPAKAKNWEGVQHQLSRGRMFVCSEELQSNVLLTSHNFIILVAPSQENFGSLDLNGWELDKIGVAAIVLSIPIHSNPISMLPNPVAPDFVTGEWARGRKSLPQRPMNITESYGFNARIAESFTGGTNALYPLLNYGLYPHLIEKFKSFGMKPASANPDNCFLVNTYWADYVRKSSVTRSLSHRTRFYALGPDFSLPAARWPLTEIWKSGGLVTFSPTFILRSPDKFAEIVDTIRITPGWATYIVPTTLAWCDKSWEHPARCPDPSKAFQTLTSCLCMDDDVRFAGAVQDGGGGLVVSYCPPQQQNSDACVKWLDWLRKVYDCGDYEPLVRLCNEARQTQFDVLQAKRRSSLAIPGNASLSGNNTPIAGSNSPLRENVSQAPLPSLDLLHVELEGIRDLIAMRQRPHIVPYRRYLYIGELSNREQALQTGDKAIDFVSADDFVAVLSGAL